MIHPEVDEASILLVEQNGVEWSFHAGLVDVMVDALRSEFSNVVRFDPEWQPAALASNAGFARALLRVHQLMRKALVKDPPQPSLPRDSVELERLFNKVYMLALERGEISRRPED